MKNSIITKVDRINQFEHNIPTKEELAASELDGMRIDAGITATSVLGAVVCERVTKVVDMVRLSAKSEWRERYQILHDYSKEPDTLPACYTIEKERKRYESSQWELMRRLDVVSNFRKSFVKEESGDGSDRFMSRIDIGEELLSKNFDELNRIMTSKLRQYKISDPKMFYYMLQTLLIAFRFNALCIYVSGLSPVFGRGGYLSDKIRLKVVEPLRVLANRCRFTTKDGSFVHMNFTKEDIAAWTALTSKLSWQKKNAGKSYTVIDMSEIFFSEDILRASWRMETHLLELKTIDDIILKSEGKDPEYRNDYSFKRVQSACSTYEQGVLNSNILAGQWQKFPRLMRNYLDSLPDQTEKYSPKPVVGFLLSVFQGADKKDQIKASFMAIWNSSYEAQNETGVKWSVISSGLKRKKNDGKNHLWFTLDEYINSCYKNFSPDIQEECMRLFPEHINKENLKY